MVHCARIEEKMPKFASRLWSGFVSALCVLLLLVVMTAVIVAEPVAKGARWVARKVGFAVSYGYERSRLGVVLVIERCINAYRKTGDSIVSFAESKLSEEKLPPRMVVSDKMDGSYPNGRDYEVNHFVSSDYCRSDSIRNGRLEDYARKDISQFTEDLMVALAAVRGVVKVNFDRNNQYEVAIEKGGAFDWEMVEVGIVKVFREHFGWGNTPIDTVHTTKYDHMRDSNGRLIHPRDMERMYI